MISPACIEVKTDRKIKCEDGKRFAIFENKNGRSFNKIRVDGCAVTNGLRADWVMELGSSAVILELKGRDVEHAAKQIHATAKL